MSGAVGEIMDDSGLKPSIVIRSGEPTKVVREYVGERTEVTALVLGAAPAGSPGPLVAHFTGADAGKLPCPVMLIPGSLATSGWSNSAKEFSRAVRTRRRSLLHPLP